MFDLFLWLDGSAARYWTVAWTVFGLWVAASVLPRSPARWGQRWNSPAIYAGLTLLMLVAFRWPGIGRNVQLDNPDESQLIAGALTVLHHGHYWGVVDCATAGPLDLIPLLLPRLLGLPLDYTTARCMGLLLLWGACVFAWLTLRRAAGNDQSARILVMPMASCIAFTHCPDFVQYTTEQAPIFYCALALWLALGAFSATGEPVGRIRLALAGGLLGVLPFSKLQAAPFALCVGIWMLWWIVRASTLTWRARLLAAGWVVGGGLGTLALMGLAIARGAGAAEFHHAFWQANLNYAEARAYPWAEAGPHLLSLVRLVWGFDSYFFPAGFLILLGLAGWPWLPPEARRRALFGAGFFLTGIFVVLAPGREFQHYLQFVILPTSLFIGLLFAGWVDGSRRPWARPAWLVLILLVGVGPQVYYRTHDDNPYHGGLPDTKIRAVGAVARHIRHLAQPGDTMVVWGWMPTFHVQTQLPQGTQDAHAERQISPNQLQAYFRARYFAALEKNRPAIFVDAVGEENFGYHNRGANGHESLPWLEEFVRRNYVLSADLETTRVYLRKDRAAALSP